MYSILHISEITYSMGIAVKYYSILSLGISSLIAYISETLEEISSYSLNIKAISHYYRKLFLFCNSLLLRMKTFYFMFTSFTRKKYNDIEILLWKQFSVFNFFAEIRFEESANGKNIICDE